MELAKEFIDPCNSFVINDNKDIRQLHTIHAKVFIVFIDFNERNIILEGDMEPVKIRKETVEYIMKTGGTPVVIYCKHMGSRTLEDRCLYSRKLTSIQYHSTLKKLALQDCVLSIDQQFSEYQISHLKNICNNP
ncbi:uncharacterized protein LOC134280176 [Saccostrea cucullata]|uniref:uncharacterized protein LOC134280176 n=1 Tax=Saccostrea cuccullata TaxID=36930 RepID=UPI002ED40660